MQLDVDWLDQQQSRAASNQLTFLYNLAYYHSIVLDWMATSNIDISSRLQQCRANAQLGFPARPMVCWILSKGESALRGITLNTGHLGLYFQTYWKWAGHVARLAN